MKRPSAAFSLMFLLATLSLVALAVRADTLEGRVIGVADGDTLTILLVLSDDGKVQEHVRLAGIDAPEKAQPFGDRAKQALSRYVFGKSVHVESSKRDKYRRIVGKVLAEGKDVNLAMVREGLAWWYRQFSQEQSPVDRSLYEATERQARADRRGLWFDPNPIPPWDWRHRGDRNPEEGDCPCGQSVPFCIGPRGGTYCRDMDGNKRYKRH